ncbi:MAG: ABC transporter ATP-binding protein [Firmicutes bacterium]|nr:ABC transporter ATP-binding protein [Bacillota bacterium]
MSAEKKSKLPWLSMALRGAKYLHAYNPGLFLVYTLSNITNGVAPYVTIFFSARIISELAGARSPERLTVWILLTVLSVALMEVLKAVLKYHKERIWDLVWMSRMKIMADKFFDMDFCLVEDGHLMGLADTVQQNEQWGARGLTTILSGYERGIRHLSGILSGIGLTFSLFAFRVPPEASAYQYLNHPIFILLIAALVMGFALLSAYIKGKAAHYWDDYAEEARLGNRVFGYFGFFGQKWERAMDIRLYRQDKIQAEWNEKDKSFMPGSSIAEQAKRGMGLYSVCATGITYVLMALIYLFVCLKARAGAFDVGYVSQYVASLTAFAAGFSGIVEEINGQKVNASFLQPFFELMDTKNIMYEGTLSTEKRSDRNYSVEFKDVSFKYPGSETWALWHVSVKCNVGEKMALVGENGSGKSTFVKLLCRLYDPTEGEILLNGIDIRKYNYAQYMDIFSVVFQDFKLLSYPLGENVAIAKTYPEDKVISALGKAGFTLDEEKFPEGLKTYLYRDFSENGVEISGGEAQKIAIARALYKDAPFLILDEPTAALDPITEAEIYSHLGEIVDDRTALFISHRLSSCRFCDEILVFDEGTLVQRGTHETLLENVSGKYHELWNAQAQYYTANG